MNQLLGKRAGRISGGKATGGCGATAPRLKFCGLVPRDKKLGIDIESKPGVVFKYPRLGI